MVIKKHSDNNKTDNPSSSLRSRTDNASLLEQNEPWEVVRARIRMKSQQIMQSLTEATFTYPPSPQKVLQMNKGLLHILQIIHESPGCQISTRKLLETINSGDLHKLIKKGEKLGFIKREKVKKPKGEKGNHMVVNSLTDDGRHLLQMAYGPDFDFVSIPIDAKDYADASYKAQSLR